VSSQTEVLFGIVVWFKQSMSRDVRSPIANCRLPIVDCRLPIADSRLPINGLRLPIED